MSRWHSSRWDALIRTVEIEMRSFSMATRRWAELDAQAIRLRRSQRKARRREAQEMGGTP